MKILEEMLAPMSATMPIFITIPSVRVTVTRARPPRLTKMPIQHNRLTDSFRIKTESRVVNTGAEEIKKLPTPADTMLIPR